MNCLKAEEQFSAYIEDELDYRAVRTFEAHLNACESCRREFTLFHESLDLLQQLPQIEPSTDFDIALKVRLVDTQVESIPFWGTCVAALARSSPFGIEWSCSDAYDGCRFLFFFKKHQSIPSQLKSLPHRGPQGRHYLLRNVELKSSDRNFLLLYLVKNRNPWSVFQNPRCLTFSRCVETNSHNFRRLIYNPCVEVNRLSSRCLTCNPCGEASNHSS